MRVPVSLVALAPLVLVGCSRTAPAPTLPTPGPAGGIVYQPFAEPETVDPGDDDEKPKAPAAVAPTAKVSSELPASVDVVLETRAECSQTRCTRSRWVEDKVTPASGAPTAVWQEVLGAGRSLTWPRHGGLDLVVVAISGEGSVQGDEAPARTALPTWTALRAQGAGVTLSSEHGVNVIVALVAREGTLEAALAQGKQAGKVRWAKRGGTIEAKSLKDAAPLTWGGGAFHARIAFGGAGEPQKESLEALIVGPGGSIAEHDHASSWEHLAILGGSGTMTVAGQPSAVKAGSVIHIPAAARHAMQNESAPLIALQLYSPSGPEQRFVALAEGEGKK